MSMRGQPQRSVPELLQDIVGNIEDIFRSELRLAKTELREEASEARKPAVTLGVGVVLAAYAVGWLLQAGVQALGTVMPLWAAALLVSVATAIVAVVLIKQGSEGLKRVHATPGKKTIATLKENGRWAKEQIG
jgi:uncharacterized membrane protein YqjE